MTDLTYRSPSTEVRESPIHGRGLFARNAIAKGEIVAVKGGHVLTGPQWRALEPTLGSAEIQIAEDLFIAPVDRDERHGCMLYVNHSCDPNVAIQGQIVLVAMRDVRAGEELDDRLGHDRRPRRGDAVPVREPQLPGDHQRQGLDEAGAAGEVPRLVLLVSPAQDRRGRSLSRVRGRPPW